ncbi:MAG: crotonobetainyl-CoA hydratase [Acidimicrobiia bacterium]|nr:crotonobetainyl-CoA hydratase [Acidimicrobiia bacterium]
MTNPISVRRDGAVLEITLDRPKANAIDAPTSRLLGDQFMAFRDDPSLRVAILTGAGDRFFSAGWDLNAAAEGEEYESDYGPGGFGGFGELPDLNKPVILAINGLAVGGGFEMTMAADFVVAAEHAEFFLPETSIGIIPDVGTVRLPRLLPHQLAMELLLTGRRCGAVEALRHGFVNRVVPANELMPAARTLAADIVAKAPLAVAAILDLVRRTRSLPVADAFALMRSGTVDLYEAMLVSEDAAEGPLAFTEKRPPKWQGT